MSCQIINNLPGIENLSYLELGTNDNSNFNAIRCIKKFSVDTNGKAMFTGTTDNYFHQLKTDLQYDIIFIDANHNFEYVVRDFNNAVSHCRGWILIHDMVPPSEEWATPPNYCSDSYRLLYFLLRETNFNVYPMDNNFGLTLIKMPAGLARPQNIYKDITYQQFVNFLSGQKLYSDQEIIDILTNSQPLSQ